MKNPDDRIAELERELRERYRARAGTPKDERWFWCACGKNPVSLKGQTCSEYRNDC